MLFVLGHIIPPVPASMPKRGFFLGNFRTVVKEKVQRVVLTPVFFFKRLILVSMDMLEAISNFVEFSLGYSDPRYLKKKKK